MSIWPRFLSLRHLLQFDAGWRLEAGGSAVKKPGRDCAPSTTSASSHRPPEFRSPIAARGQERRGLRLVFRYAHALAVEGRQACRCARSARLHAGVEEAPKRGENRNGDPLRFRLRGHRSSGRRTRHLRGRRTRRTSAAGKTSSEPGAARSFPDRSPRPPIWPSMIGCVRGFAEAQVSFGLPRHTLGRVGRTAINLPEVR